MIKQKTLSYELNALEPFISAQTMDIHYHKHYKAYLDKTNQLLPGTGFENKPLNDVVIYANSDKAYQTLFNQSAQALNHEFFFNSITPDKTKQEIPEPLLSRINHDFSSVENLLETLIDTGVKHFASGWVWLISKNKKLSIKSTQNAQTPFVKLDETPLLTIDIWEHAYYLDYQNRRQEYLKNLVTTCLNWHFANQNYLSS